MFPLQIQRERKIKSIKPSLHVPLNNPLLLCTKGREGRAWTTTVSSSRERETAETQGRGGGGVPQPGGNRGYLGLGQRMGRSTAPGSQRQAQSRYALGCVVQGKSAQPLWALPAPQGSYFSTGGRTQGALAEVTRFHKCADGRAGDWVQGQQTRALAVS